MATLHLAHYVPASLARGRMYLPPSKSLLARYLLLSAIQGREELGVSGCQREDLPEDLRHLIEALEGARRGCTTINVGESGTAMRFVLAYLAASTTRTVRLEGERRQHQRPIGSLVEALRALGGRISYIEVEGYPPLQIEPSRLSARAIELDASASSQYLSALMLIAPLLEGTGYSIDVRRSGLVSAPYAEMTLQSMLEAGYYWQQSAGVYSYLDRSVGRMACSCTVEADWTAASYAYLLLALGAQESDAPLTMVLPHLRRPSAQGDSLALPDLMMRLGIDTRADAEGVELEALSPLPLEPREVWSMDCSSSPDLVPTLVAVCLARRQPFEIHGVAHLRIKESDRLSALEQECAKLGYALALEADSIGWYGRYIPPMYDDPVVLDTHGDHRMAMALAPWMASENPEGVVVCEAEVVDKSFPSYWRELVRLGYTIREIQG